MTSHLCVFAGENLEMACRREVEEEVGVKVGKVEFIASQPWPLPNTLMIGFSAQAQESTDLQVSALTFNYTYVMEIFQSFLLPPLRHSASFVFNAPAPSSSERTCRYVTLTAISFNNFVGCCLRHSVTSLPSGSGYVFSNFH